MRGRLRHALTCALCMAALISLYCIGASAYTYSSNLPSDVSSLRVTIGDVTLPLAEYPDGAYFDPEKSTMTVAEQSQYGINAGGDLNLRGWECVGFARYVYAALFYKYPQDATMDNQLAYSSDYSSIYYRNVIKDTLGTNTLAGGYSAATLKTLISACQPGAVMRVGGHSLVVMAIYNDGLVVYDNNFANDNEVDVRSYTWQRFVDSLGSRGISALQMPAYYPGYSYSTGGSSNNTYPVDTSTAGTYLVYNCSSLNVRAAPTTSSAVVGSIASGTTVKVKGSYNGWAQISYNGVDRWVYMTYLKSTATSLVVTFDAAGGSVSETSHTYAHGGTFGSLPTPTRTDCTFLGWFNGSTQYTASSSVPSTAALTLTAHWAVMGFEDVSPSQWYAPYVITACKYGLIMKDTKFNPNSNATRGQFVTVLAREYERESGKSYDVGKLGSSIFTDVKPNSYCDKAIAWAYVNKITLGTTATEFSPNANVSREQIAAFLYRYSKAIGVAVTYSGSSLIYNFKDGGSVSNFAKEAMNWAISIGLYEGDGKGYLNPKNPARRSEMVAIMSRYIDYLTANYSGTISLKPLGDVEPDAADADVVDDPETPEDDSMAEAPAETPDSTVEPTETPDVPETTPPESAEESAADDAASELELDIPNESDAA